MFIETSSPRRAGDVARLISPAFNPVSSSGRCISFWYTMYGQTIDKFRVIVTAQGMARYSQTVTKQLPVFQSNSTVYNY